MMPLLLLLAPLLLQDDAAALYRSMSRAVDEAPTLSGPFQASVESGPKTLAVEGSLSLKAPNRLDIRIEISDGDGRRPMSLVCDGGRTADGSAAPSPAPPDLLPRLLAGWKPLGGTALLLFGTRIRHDARARNDLPDLGRLVTLDAFETLGTERVGEREAHVIKFTASVREAGALKVRLWIDAGTSLPLKREVAGTWAGMPVKVVETSTLSAGAEIPDSQFELPR